MVTSSVLSPVDGAVNKPDVEIEPALAVQVTAELKLLVPVTVAEHWLVWPYRISGGEQFTATNLMEDEKPPPQTAIPKVPAIASNCPNLSM